MSFLPVDEILFNHSEIRLAVAKTTTGGDKKMQRRESFLPFRFFFPLIVFLLIPLFAFSPNLLDLSLTGFVIQFFSLLSY